MLSLNLHRLNPVPSVHAVIRKLVSVGCSRAAEYGIVIRFFAIKSPLVVRVIHSVRAKRVDKKLKLLLTLVHRVMAEMQGRILQKAVITCCPFNFSKLPLFLTSPVPFYSV